MSIKVLGVSCWEFGQSNLKGSSGLTGQVTRCEYQGIVFYVRENVNATPAFNISSGERWGDKVGRKPSRFRQSLELLAPELHWEEIAQLVRQADTLGRPVLRNKLFNRAFIDHCQFR
jgi:hypothetical protein